MKLHADNSRSSSREFLEDTLRQCRSHVAELKSTLDAYVREKEAEIEQFRRTTMIEIMATEAVIDAVGEQLGRCVAYEHSPANMIEVRGTNKPQSHSKKIVNLAKQILMEEGQPLGRQALIDRLIASDLGVISNDLPGLVTKALSRSGEFRVEKRRYWLADKPPVPQR